MRLKGIEKFREKVPALSGKKIFFLPLYAFSILLFSVRVMIGFDAMPGLAKSGETNLLLFSFFPLIGEIVICVVGLTFVYQMWFWKDRLKARYGQLSYQHIFFVGFTGIACMLSLSVNLFVHFWSFSRLFWENSPLKFLATPLETYAHSLKAVVFSAKMILCVFFSGLGLLMILRSLETFGFDYMTVIYLYFPEESRMQDHRIYSVLRHPTYAGALLIGLGGMFSTLTLYAVVFFMIYLAAFTFHIHFVEEKELVARFGPSYRDYRNKVPAFFVRPDKLGVLLGFLLGKPGPGLKNLP